VPTSVTLGIGCSADPAVPEDLAPFLHKDRHRLRISGDPHLATPIYVIVDPDAVHLTTHPAGLCRLLAASSRSRNLAEHALSHLIHDGQVPLPGTVLEGVWMPGAGDTITVDRRSGHVTRGGAFPYTSERSRGTSEPSTRRLRELLTRATATALEGSAAPALMVSAGKDSTAVAYAAARASWSVLGITYTTSETDEETIAASTCRRFGHEHRTVRLADFSDAELRRALDRFFARTPLPSGDLAQIPYALCMQATADHADRYLDGTGNDVPFFFLPTSLERRLRAVRPPRVLRAAVPAGSPFRYLLRTAIERGYAGLRYQFEDTRRFCSHTHDTTARWDRLQRRLAGRSIVDVRALTRGRHVESGSIRHKVDLATAAFDRERRFPFMDAELFDYVFHLPAEHRYDERWGRSKLLLRRLLREDLGYDDEAVGKRAFTFDGNTFLERMREVVREELLACDLFDRRTLEARIRRDLDRCERGWRRAWQPVVGLYQLAAWRNRHPGAAGPTPPGAGRLDADPPR